MDKHQLNKISKSFDEQYDEAFLDAQLPDLWRAISNKLDEMPLTEGRVIKESFETQHDDQSIEEALSPLLWSNIAQQLDRPEGHVVKDSFEALDSPEPSNSIWYAVEAQLEIESVWKNIRRVLDKRTRGRYWRDKLAQVSLAALALLWIRGCYPDYHPIEPVQPIATHTSQPLATTQQAAPTSSTPAARQHHLMPTTTVWPAEPSNLEPIQQSTTARTWATDEILTGSDPIHQNAQAPPVPPVSPVTGASQPPVQVEPTPPINAVAQLPQQSVSTSAPSSGAQERQTALEKIAQNRPAIAELVAAIPLAPPSLWEPHLIANQYERIPVEGPWLPDAAPAAPLDKGLVEPVIQQLAAKENYAPIHRWEVGLETRLSNSLLWGETTTKAMDATSMTSTQMQTLASVGMVVAWHWSHRDALLLTAHPAVNSQQYFGGYTNEGRYYWQQVRLTRAEGTFSYQRTLWRGNFWHGQTSRLYARALYHFSHLTRGEERINDELIETTSTYQRWQHSAGLAVGTSQQIHRWGIDVGVHSTCGLSTMSQSGTPWSDSRLVTWGGYIGLRYRL